MYKVFDGSAIMAIGQQTLLLQFVNICSSTFEFEGMLVQEYIAEALDSQPPDEWGIEDESERDTDINME